MKELSQEDKLKAIIEKSIERGWTELGDEVDHVMNYILIGAVIGLHYHPEPVLFSHEWARKYYGVTEVEADLIVNVFTNDLSNELDDVEYLKLPAWQFHLREQSMADNVIDYAWEHMNK